MEAKKYKEWREKDPVFRRAEFLKGKREPIIIMGIPTGRPSDRFIEGFVVKSDSAQFPVGYVSFVWCAESFEFTEGTVEFKPPGLKNIGGGFLPSSNYSTYDPLEVGNYTLQVHRSETEDTHFAKWREKGRNWCSMAEHPNGHSCKELIERISAWIFRGDDSHTLEQFDYLLDCGGMGMKRENFITLLKDIKASITHEA